MLEESYFIQKECCKKTYSFWICACFSFILILGVITFDAWATSKLDSQQQHSSFFYVTNREISLFLWHHPHLMRVHAKNKIGYLPGFQYLHKINMEPGFTEKICIVPPNVLFLYHTWKRLISSYLPKRKIDPQEFKEFLNCLEEWQPHHWEKAPKHYAWLINNQNFNQLPFEVLQAFYGWKNYYKEGEIINAFKPTFSQLKSFLEEYPQFARHYWKHILSDEFPNYLKTFAEGNFNLFHLVPSEEIAPFLKVALYNYTKNQDEAL